MGSSLRDQLVKAGLATKQQANSLNAKSRKKKNRSEQQANSDIAAKKAAEEKRARDKALNEAIQEKQKKAAIKGQIKTIIETNAVEDHRGESAYSYVMGAKVRQLFVNSEIHQQLADDKLAITRLNGKTYLVPVAIAEQVLGLNPEWAVVRPGEESPSAPEDDPYAGYEVPDDLDW